MSCDSLVSKDLRGFFNLQELTEDVGYHKPLGMKSDINHRGILVEKGFGMLLGFDGGFGTRLRVETANNGLVRL